MLMVMGSIALNLSLFSPFSLHLSLKIVPILI